MRPDDIVNAVVIEKSALLHACNSLQSCSFGVIEFAATASGSARDDERHTHMRIETEISPGAVSTFQFVRKSVT
jgi:hypothetical protein